MVGCGGASKSSLHQAEKSAGLLSILKGRLYGNQATGCIWVGTKNRGDEVIWPPGYRVRGMPPQLLHGGRVVAESGDLVRLAGGLDFRYPRSQRCAGFVQTHKFAADHVLRG
jgi:hypothetical protein